MERHLEGCGSCRGTCESLRRMLAVCRESHGPDVPADVADSVRVALRRHLAEAH